jgi:aminomethyltransferase
VIDHSDRTKVRVSGPDRVSFLNGLVTQDLAALGPGRCTYALVLNPKGKVVGDVWVYALEDAFLLDLLPEVPGRILDHIRRHMISDEVVLEEFPFVAHLAVHGPSAIALARRILRGADIPEPGEFRTVAVDRRRSLLAAQTSYLRLPGVQFLSWTDSLDDVWRALTAAGAVPLGREAWNTLRIEAGRPKAGVDMDEDTIALEARLEGAISFTKGCYEGQEVIARATYQGHMNRLLVGFRVEGDLVPARGDPVVGEGQPVGRVTSAAYSPTLRSVIALGYVRVPADEPGTRVTIESQGWQLRAAVARLPFI